METQELSDNFSLFHKVNTEILDRLLAIASEESYESGEVVIDQVSWGKSIFFINSGWVKLEYVYREQTITLELIGKGGFIGEAGVLGNSVINSRVVAISEVQILAVSAQRFIQFLYQYPQIQNRLLNATVTSLGKYQQYSLFHRQTMKVRLATILIALADRYGETTEQGIKLYNFDSKDLADLAQITLSAYEPIMNKLIEKGLVTIDKGKNRLYLPNLKPLHHIIGQLGYE